MRNVSDKSCRENQNTHFVFNNFFPRKSYRLWNNVEKNITERGSPQMTIWRMRIACSIHKATNTHSECVILITFPLQQCWHERASMLRCMYIACCIHKATKTHSEYVILITFPLQQCLHERVSMLRYTYIACCIHKATKTNSQYVIHITFPLQQCLHERASVLRCM
jgi:hypothetical protein